MDYPSLSPSARGIVARAARKAEACERRRRRCRTWPRRKHHRAQRQRWARIMQFRYFRAKGYTVLPYGVTGIIVCLARKRRRRMKAVMMVAQDMRHGPTGISVKFIKVSPPYRRG